MIIKRKLEGRNKLRVQDEKCTLIYIKFIMKKDLLNRTGSSMGKKTVASYIRKKTEE